MNLNLARHCAAIALCWLAAGAAQAQSSPYYLGVAQSIGYDSNLYRLDSSQALPPSVRSKSDTLYTTSLVAGVDQTWGRQRLSGSGSVRSNRFAQNDQLNNNGFGLNLGLDWETVGRLSGNLSVALNRNLRRFDSAELVTPERNIEDNRLYSGTVRLGVVTRLTAETTLSRRAVRFSAASFSGSEYNQDQIAVGLRYRPGGAWVFNPALRQSKVGYLNNDNRYKRQDIDLSANWTPSALSQLNARISHTRTTHELRPLRDFSGVTGEVRGSAQVTGKLKLSASLSRDLGQTYSTFSLGPFVQAADFTRVTNGLRLSADFEMSSKVSFNATVDHQRRDLSSRLTDNFTVGGADRGTSASLGARWLPLRSTQVGCSIGHDQRSVSAGTNGTVGRPYSGSNISCYGQFILQ